LRIGIDVLDGFRRYIVNREVRESQKKAEVEIIIQRGIEKLAEARPRIINDKDSQFIAWDFKAVIKIIGMKHVRTSLFCQQIHSKIARRHKELKMKCIRPKQAMTFDEVILNVAVSIYHYKNACLQYLAPRDKLLGRAESTHKARVERKQARKRAATTGGEKAICLKGWAHQLRTLCKLGRLVAASMTGPESQPECYSATGFNKHGGKFSELH
jgi:hypothetical protein